MGYLSCKAESSIISCDPYNWDRRKRSGICKNEPTKIRHFSYAELESATGGFSPASFLGKGSHGSVYRAVLDDGKLVAAVKKTMTWAGATLQGGDFNNMNNHPVDNEIEVLSRIRSPRLVNLLGFSVDAKEKKLLVVEFMENGSLYDLLHAKPRPPGWAKRIRFALQTAKAIETLHSSNPPVIHRDIKSSNVLVDGNWNARLGDFGLALRGHVEDVKIRCTPPAGTLGYLDPGYVLPENLSAKSDVFSFGILLLEIISGRNAIDVNYSPPSVVHWALPLIKQFEFALLFDPRIGPPGDPSVMRQLAVLAARCVGSTAEKRPSMAEVVECLQTVSKKVPSAVWNNLRKRVKKTSPAIDREVFDDGKEEAVVKTSKSGSRASPLRNTKVSSVPPAMDSVKEAMGSIGAVAEEIGQEAVSSVSVVSENFGREAISSVGAVPVGDGEYSGREAASTSSGAVPVGDGEY
ncbi:PREDICTED: serine/threonine-protein kinase-like protein At3g51990, partial [Nelumbo nucifera]